MLKIHNFIALPGETTSQRHSRLARLLAENPTVMTQEMAVRLFMESYPTLQQNANRYLLRRQPGRMALSANWTLKHVAEIIHEEENEMAWSKMLLMKRLGEEVHERRPSFPLAHGDGKRLDGWNKRAKFAKSASLTYVRSTAGSPPPPPQAWVLTAAAA